MFCFFAFLLRWLFCFLSLITGFNGWIVFTWFLVNHIIVRLLCLCVFLLTILLFVCCACVILSGFCCLVILVSACLCCSGTCSVLFFIIYKFLVFFLLASICLLLFVGLIDSVILFVVCWHWWKSYCMCGLRMGWYSVFQKLNFVVFVFGLSICLLMVAILFVQRYNFCFCFSAICWFGFSFLVQVVACIGLVVQRIVS